jgi:O-antigen/teichoic acid export membrane protein
MNVSSLHGRAQERHRRLLLTTAASVGARLVSLATIVISVPLTANYLGVERYGLWVTIGSLLALTSIADLGIGNGLLNAIAECHGHGDSEGARRYIASSFAMLTTIALLAGLLFAVLYPWLPWQRIFNVSDPLAVAEAGPATAAVFVCFLANIPLNVIQRVQQGYQEGFADSAWAAGGKLLSLACLFVVVWLRGGLPSLVMAVSGIPVVVSCINGIALFGFRKPSLRPRLADVHWAYTKRILDTGFLFFVIQIAAAVAYSTDNLILAHMIRPSAVTEYSIVYQMFSFGPILLSMFLNALWPAYGEAMVRGDSQWIRSTFHRSIVIGLAVNVPYSVTLMFFGNQVIRVWVGNRVSASFLVLLAFMIWTIMNSFNGAIAVFLNGANAMRFQAICASIMACVNLVLSIVLTRMIGLSGVIWGSIIAHSLVIFVPSSIFISRLMQRLMIAGHTHGELTAFEAE